MTLIANLKLNTYYWHKSVMSNGDWSDWELILTYKARGKLKFGFVCKETGLYPRYFTTSMSDSTHQFVEVIEP